jgi:hypothetical protein
VVSFWLRERGAAAAKDATVPAGSAEGAAQADSLAAMRSASMMVVTLVATEGMSGRIDDLGRRITPRGIVVA